MADVILPEWEEWYAHDMEHSHLAAFVTSKRGKGKVSNVQPQDPTDTIILNIDK